MGLITPMTQKNVCVWVMFDDVDPPMAPQRCNGPDHPNDAKNACVWVTFDDVDSPNDAKTQWGGLITQSRKKKDAIGPYEGNVGLSRNLTVVLLCNGRAASHAV